MDVHRKEQEDRGVIQMNSLWLSRWNLDSKLRSESTILSVPQFYLEIEIYHFMRGDIWGLNSENLCFTSII